jgi:hypothetical protein
MDWTLYFELMISSILIIERLRAGRLRLGNGQTKRQWSVRELRNKKIELKNELKSPKVNITIKLKTKKKSEGSSTMKEHCHV